MTMLQVQRDEYSAPFFDAAANGQLLLRRCNECTHVAEPAAVRCSKCNSSDVDWVESVGTGRLVTWAIPHVKGEAGAMVPSYVIGVVELAEGAWLYAQVRADDLAAIDGQAMVTVEFESVEGGEALPVARFASA